MAFSLLVSFDNDCIWHSKLFLYDKNMKLSLDKIHSLYTDTQQNPREKAAWWVEYVCRHKGAKILQSRQFEEAPWYQYHHVDIIVFIMTVIFTIISILILICNICCTRKVKIEWKCWQHTSDKMKIDRIINWMINLRILVFHCPSERCLVKYFVEVAFETQLFQQSRWPTMGVVFQWCNMAYFPTLIQCGYLPPCTYPLISQTASCFKSMHRIWICTSPLITTSL